MLSKKALEKLYNFIGNETKCRQDEDGNEDLEMGRFIQFRLTEILEIREGFKLKSNANLFDRFCLEKSRSSNTTIYIKSFQVDVLLKTLYSLAIKTL